MSGVSAPQTYFINPALFSYLSRPSFIHRPQTNLTNKWDNCFAAAGARYQIEPLLLKAISAGESSLKPGAININKDRKTGKASSTDYGLMQINSTHIPKLIKMGVIKKSEDLITKPCLNIHIGSWILASIFRYVASAGIALDQTMPYFRKDRHETREQYANKVWRIYRDMKGICLPGQGGRQCRQS